MFDSILLSQVKRQNCSGPSATADKIASWRNAGIHGAPLHLDEFQLLFSCREIITFENMHTIRTGILVATIMSTVLGMGVAADTGNLLVDSYGKLLLIGPDGTQNVLRDSIITASLSPDGRRAAFTYDENPRAFPNSSQILSVMTVPDGRSQQMSNLAHGSHDGP